MIAQWVCLFWQDVSDAATLIGEYILFFNNGICNTTIVTVGHDGQSSATRETSASPYICIFGKPVDIPSARPMNISNHKLKIFKVERCDGVKADIEKDQSPLEKGIGGVGFERSVFTIFPEIHCPNLQQSYEFYVV